MPANSSSVQGTRTAPVCRVHVLRGEHTVRHDISWSCLHRLVYLVLSTVLYIVERATDVSERHASWQNKRGASRQPSHPPRGKPRKSGAVCGAKYGRRTNVASYVSAKHFSAVKLVHSESQLGPTETSCLRSVQSSAAKLVQPRSQLWPTVANRMRPVQSSSVKPEQS